MNVVGFGLATLTLLCPLGLLRLVCWSLETSGRNLAFPDLGILSAPFSPPPQKKGALRPNLEPYFRQAIYYWVASPTFKVKICRVGNAASICVYAVDLTTFQHGLTFSGNCGLDLCLDGIIAKHLEF